MVHSLAPSVVLWDHLHLPVPLAPGSHACGRHAMLDSISTVRQDRSTPAFNSNHTTQTKISRFQTPRLNKLQQVHAHQYSSPGSEAHPRLWSATIASGFLLDDDRPFWSLPLMYKTGSLFAETSLTFHQFPKKTKVRWDGAHPLLALWASEGWPPIKRAYNLCRPDGRPR